MVQFLLHGPEPSVITRPALRLDPPVPRSTAGAVTTTLHQATGSPAAIG